MFPELSLSDITITNPSETLFIIGNGFDLMHGVRSSYWDFHNSLKHDDILVFYLTNYLKVGPDELWSDFEYSLSKIDVQAMLDAINWFFYDFGVYGTGDVKASGYFSAIDAALLPIQVITASLPKSFRRWVGSLTMEPSNTCVKMITPESKYLNFNYTEFLETRYGVSPERITYIHGCRKRQKGGKKSKLILGHSQLADYFSEYDLTQSVPKDVNKWRRALLEDAVEQGINQWIEFYEETFSKHSEEIIEDNKEFFYGLEHMKDIVVIGHSLSEVDDPYFAEVMRCNNGKAFWHVGCHTQKDLDGVFKFVDRIGISRDLFEIFST